MHELIHTCVLIYIYTYFYTDIHSCLYTYKHTYLHADMLVYTCACLVIHIHSYIHTHSNIYTFMHVFLHAIIFTCKEHIFVSAFINICIHTYRLMDVCAGTNIYMCVYIHIHINTDRHVYMYTYVNTYMKSQARLVYTYIQTLILNYKCSCLHACMHTEFIHFSLETQNFTVRYFHNFQTSILPVCPDFQNFCTYRIMEILQI